MPTKKTSERTRQFDNSINHPLYYGGDTTYEAVKVIEAWGLGFNLGNCVKYISRAGKKPGADIQQDLEKALWYLDREVENLKKKLQEERNAREVSGST